MKNKRAYKKALSVLFSVVLLISGTMPISAHAENAAGSLCLHHQKHTAECSYTEGSEGTPCNHTHDDACGYVAAAEEIPCSMNCTDINADGIIDHQESCAYASAVEGAPCQHQHDENCGYSPAVAGTPCTYVCEICNSQSSDDPAGPECACETLCTEDAVNTDCPVCGADGADLTLCKGTIKEVQALIDALPTEEELEAMDETAKAEVFAQIEAIYTAIAALDETDAAQLNMDKLNALANFVKEANDIDRIIVADSAKLEGNGRINITRQSDAEYTISYPGVTEEVCVPILEAESGLRCGADFTVGYSPERINPGDKVHTLETIKKIVSGSDAPTLDLLAELYGTVVRAGIHRAPSIKVAEAAKVIENTQRDLNIALMNELSIIFDRLGIDTLDVLEAAGTKWNFLPFRPGLVGGHCIGVDPYYLTFKAEELGCHPQVILAGRRINDGMGKHVAETCVKLLIRQGRLVNAARVGILGFTFKENVPDLRNTRVIDVIRELQEYGVDVLVHDPLADAGEVRHEYGLSFAALDELASLAALILAVPHKAYAENGVLEPAALHARFAVPDKALLLDVKGCLSPSAVQAEGMAYWRL